MKKNLSSVPYAAPLLLLAVFLGCSKHEDTSATKHPQQVQPAKPVVSAPVQKQHSSATRAGMNLDFKHRVDPFRPFAPSVEVAPVGRSGQSNNRSYSEQLPIQSFEAAKFKVVGIVAGLKENKALLIDPNGKGYVVQEGMLLGSNDGRITRITSSAVEVVERFKDDSGRFRKRKVVLTLAKKR